MVAIFYMCMCYSADFLTINIFLSVDESFPFHLIFSYSWRLSDWIFSKPLSFLSSIGLWPSRPIWSYSLKSNFIVRDKFILIKKTMINQKQGICHFMVRCNVYYEFPEAHPPIADQTWHHLLERTNYFSHKQRLDMLMLIQCLLLPHKDSKSNV